MRKPPENRERTTGAEDTQNQHYQRLRTVVDSCLKLLLVLRSVDMAGVDTPPRFETSHRNTDTHQQVSINFTRESKNNDQY